MAAADVARQTRAVPKCADGFHVGPFTEARKPKPRPKPPTPKATEDEPRKAAE